MNVAIQYDLFEPLPTPEDMLRKEIEALQEQQEKYRKSIFAKHSEMMKLFMKQQDELDKLAAMIAKQREEIKTLKNQLR